MRKRGYKGFAMRLERRALVMWSLFICVMLSCFPAFAQDAAAKGRGFSLFVFKTNPFIDTTSKGIGAEIALIRGDSGDFSGWALTLDHYSKDEKGWYEGLDCLDHLSGTQVGIRYLGGTMQWKIFGGAAFVGGGVESLQVESSYTDTVFDGGWGYNTITVGSTTCRVNAPFLEAGVRSHWGYNSKTWGIGIATIEGRVLVQYFPPKTVIIGGIERPLGGWGIGAQLRIGFSFWKLEHG